VKARLSVPEPGRKRFSSIKLSGVSNLFFTDVTAVPAARLEPQFKRVALILLPRARNIPKYTGHQKKKIKRIDNIVSNIFGYYR